MDEIEPLELARQIVAERFPKAQAAFLSGSALTADRTPTSDLDIVVFLDDDQQAFRETIREHGWLIELFVQTPWSFNYFVNLETRARRSPLLQMCADGAILVSVDHAAENFQLEAHRLLMKGPPPITQDEIERRRYELTDLLDDFDGSTSSDELAFVTGELLVKSSELVLLTARRWLGTGKWLARQLAKHDAQLLGRLNDGVRAALGGGDRAPLRSAVEDVLATVGGPFSEGYRITANVLPKPTRFKDPA